MEEIKGIIEEVIYYNEENAYTVATVKTEDDLYTVVGYLPLAEVGRSFLFSGETKLHPTYGQQFNFKEFEEILPESKEGIIAFLSSGIVKGIGPKTALSIVDKFGTDSLRIMGEEPEKLSEVDGIGYKKADSIGESYRTHREIANIVMFFQSYGIGTAYAIKLYKVYGKDTIAAVRENPYRLVNDVFGIGFKTADLIADRLGINHESEFRIASGVKYFLSMMASEGHTFMPKTILTEKVGMMLDLPEEFVEDVLPELGLTGEIRIEQLENRTVIFLMPYYVAETNICKALVKLANHQRQPLMVDIDALIKSVENDLDIELAANQRQAAKSAIENGVCVITGGPGTGKTTTINTVIRVFEKSGLKISIAAPTGRAAKRITETSGYEAKTIHRMLEYTYSRGEGSEMRFARNRENPIDSDVVIIDEASMVDILLMNGLLNGLKDTARLILVGDADQLPPIGAGNVLKDIIESELIHTVRLNEIFRQAKESLIVVNAHRINKGEYPSFNENDKDFFLMKRKTEISVLETIKELCVYRLPNYFQECSGLSDVQVLTPVKKGILGAINLNTELQSVLNPPKPHLREKKLKSRVFREGDKVMQIKNNYEISWKRVDDFTDGEGVFNGDMGYIDAIDNEYNEITVIYEGIRAVKYDFVQIEELDLAYAITVHKSQGSEYPIVIMPLSWFPPMLATRNLLYTAVTRAKKAVILIGNESFMNAMVDNNRITERYSGLKARLSAFLEIEI